MNLKQIIYTFSLIHMLSFHSFPRPTHSILTVSVALKESIFKKSLSSVLRTNLLEEGGHVSTGPAAEDWERSFIVNTPLSSMCDCSEEGDPNSIRHWESSVKKLMNAA